MKGFWRHFLAMSLWNKLLLLLIVALILGAACLGGFDCDHQDCGW